MKKLSAAVGTYQQGNETKTRWASVGVLGMNSNGKEYVLLDPGVSTAGLLVLQNNEAIKQGKSPSDMLMTGVFEEQQNNNPTQNNNHQNNQNQNNNQGFQNHPQGVNSSQLNSWK